MSRSKISKKISSKRRVYKRKAMSRKSSMRTIINKTVSRALMRKTETKVNFVNYVNEPFNSTISVSADLYNLIPSIAQGTDDNNRIGNSIQPLYTNIRGYVGIHCGDTLYDTLGPLDVQLFCLRGKTRKDGSVYPRPTSDLDIIKRGITKQQFDGTFASSCSPVNVEDFQIIFKKNFRLIPIPTTSSSTGSAPTSFSLPNNSNSGSTIYKLKHKINWAKIGVKKFLYESTSASQPINENIFWCLGFAQYNNPNAAVAATYTPVQVSMQAMTYYKDM